VKIKTDENIPTRVIRLLRENDQDVATVRDEHLVGASDRRLAEVARDEGRILVTLDRGFTDVRLTRPGPTPASSSYTPENCVSA
jgi:predicted nuclease of predicted toxin-antitoxin system